jgi:hypothetical protein
VPRLRAWVRLSPNRMYAIMQRVVVNVEVQHTLLCSSIPLSVPWGKSF